MRVLATLLASLLCGAAFSSAFAPLAWWWAGLAGLALQLGLTGLTAIGVRRALASQFAFGLGWFAPGLAWTANSMTEHGHMPVVAAFLGVVLLALVCSAFTAAAAGAVVRTTRPGVGRLVALTGAWTLAEWMRGPGLVHFGWLTPAEITPDLPWAGWAPLGGASAVTLALLLGAASLALLVDAALRCARAGARSGDVQRVVGATSVLALLVGAGWVAHEHEWSTPGETVTLRLLQADLPIVDVFTRTDAGERIASVAAQAGAPWPEETVQADRTERRLVVTPEGMVTTPVERLPRSGVEALGRLLDVAGAPVLFSGFRKTPTGYANTAFFGDASGVEAYVDKRRLVPFGEYVPPGFRWFVERLGIPLSDLAEGGWDQRPNRPWGPTGPSVGVLICYENVDGAVLESWGKDVPDLLLVTSNLGWFSPYVIPQHLAMSRLRAMEAARPLVSVNNNGLSTVLDARGNVVETLAASGRDARTVTIASALGAPTPYLAYGDLPALLAAVLFLVSGFFPCRRRGAAASDGRL